LNSDRGAFRPANSSWLARSTRQSREGKRETLTSAGPKREKISKKDLSQRKLWRGQRESRGEKKTHIAGVNWDNVLRLLQDALGHADGLGLLHLQGAGVDGHNVLGLLERAGVDRDNVLGLAKGQLGGGGNHFDFGFG